MIIWVQLLKFVKIREVFKKPNILWQKSSAFIWTPVKWIVFDFYDRLKSISSGYASFDYEIIITRGMVKLGILVNAGPVDALAYDNT